jgi:hypothetical protein
MLNFAKNIKHCYKTYVFIFEKSYFVTTTTTEKWKILLGETLNCLEIEQV